MKGIFFAVDALHYSRNNMKKIFHALLLFTLLFSSMSRGMFVAAGRLTKQICHKIPHQQVRLFSTIPSNQLFVNRSTYELGITPGGILKSPKQVVEECDDFLKLIQKRSAEDNCYPINHYPCWVEELAIAKKLHRNALYAFYISDQYQSDIATQSDFDDLENTREIIRNSRDYSLDQEKFRNFENANTHITGQELRHAYYQHCLEEEARILKECMNVDAKDGTYKAKLRSQIKILEQIILYNDVRIDSYGEDVQRLKNLRTLFE